MILQTKIILISIIFLFFTQNIYSEKTKPHKAKAYILGDMQSGKILEQKNETEIYPIASIVKIVTAIVSNQHFSKEEYIKIPDKKLIVNQLESRANIEIGEEYRFADLLYGLVLPSGNDVARVLDWELKKKDLEYTELAEKWAKKNKLDSSQFLEPIGLSASTSSSARDLWKVLNIVYQNDTLYEILNTESYNLISRNKREVNVKTRNPILEYKKYFVRGKTGTTKKAGQCFVGFIRNQKEDWGVVILGAKDVKYEIKLFIDSLNKKTEDKP